MPTYPRRRLNKASSIVFSMLAFLRLVSSFEIDGDQRVLGPEHELATNTFNFYGW
jgi:hypothetical protein